MVAANTIALLTLLPALALAAVSPNHDSALARSNAHRGNAPRAIGSAQSRSRRRGQCRVRPAATEASAAAPAPTEESATPAEESTTPAEESTPTEESTTTTGSEDEAQTEGDSQAADTTEQPTTSASAEQEAESTPVNNNLAALPNSNSGLLYTTGYVQNRSVSQFTDPPAPAVTTSPTPTTPTASSGGSTVASTTTDGTLPSSPLTRSSTRTWPPTASTLPVLPTLTSFTPRRASTTFRPS